MVPGIADEEPADGRIHQQWVIRSRKNGDHIRQSIIPDVPIHKEDHVGIDVNGVYPSAAADAR